MLSWSVALTLKVRLYAQIADRKPQDGELVELGENTRLERQQAGQILELAVQPLAVTLARIRLLTLSRRMLVA